MCFNPTPFFNKHKIKCLFFTITNFCVLEISIKKENFVFLSFLIKKKICVFEFSNKKKKFVFLRFWVSFLMFYYHLCFRDTVCVFDIVVLCFNNLPNSIMQTRFVIQSAIQQMPDVLYRGLCCIQELVISIQYYFKYRARQGVFHHWKKYNHFSRQSLSNVKYVANTAKVHMP